MHHSRMALVLTAQVYGRPNDIHIPTKEHVMRSVSARAGRAVLAAATVALSACSNHPNSTATSPDLQPRYLISGGGGVAEPTPVISSLSLSSTTLVLNGPAVGYTTTISD